MNLNECATASFPHGWFNTQLESLQEFVLHTLKTKQHQHQQKEHTKYGFKLITIMYNIRGCFRKIILKNVYFIIKEIVGLGCVLDYCLKYI